jgi:hypothetical protein
MLQSGAALALSNVKDSVSCFVRMLYFKRVYIIHSVLQCYVPLARDNLFAFIHSIRERAATSKYTTPFCPLC